jgi:hypothetical protein
VTESEAGRPGNRVLISHRDSGFFSLQPLAVHTGSYTMGNGDSAPKVKWPWGEAETFTHVAPNNA